MGKSPCCDHKSGLKKGPWTSDEDQKLIDYIHRNGYGNWRTLPRNAGLQRCGKSCRLRWTNYLRPDIKRGRFSLEEEQLIIHLHSILGNKWSAIASRLPGRTDNEIKNYWNTHIRKTLIRMGIDPVTHCPTPLYYNFLHLSSEMFNSSPDHHMFIAMTSSTNPPLMLSQNHKEYFTPQITTSSLPQLLPSQLQTTLIHQDLTHLIPTAPHLDYKPQNPKPNFALEHFGQVNDDQWQQSQLSYPTGDGGGYDYGGLEDHPIPNSTMDETETWSFGSNYSGLQSVSLAAPSCSQTPVVHSNNSSTCNVYNYYYS